MPLFTVAVVPSRVHCVAFDGGAGAVVDDRLDQFVAQRFEIAECRSRSDDHGTVLLERIPDGDFSRVFRTVTLSVSSL